MSSQMPEPDLPPRIQPVFSPPARRKKSKNLWLVLLLVPLGLFAAVLLLVGAGALFVLTATEETPTEAERQLVVDAERVAEFSVDFASRKEHESIIKRRYIDRSFDIEYEYDDPDENAPLHKQ